MKHVKTVTALAAAIIFAASFTAGNPYFAYAQDIDTPAKASLSAAADTSGEAEAVSGVSEEASGPEIYAGEYIMFGLGDMETNFQNKKVVVDNEGMESGSIILNADGTGILADADIQEPVTKWSAAGGNLSIICEDFEFTGTIEDGVIMLWHEPSADSLYFALEDADLSAYTIAEEDEYETLCMAGTYYLTDETMADGSTFLNRTQISLNVLNGLGEASLKLYEDGTGALDVGDHRDISWNTDKIILNGGEYDLDLEDGVITVDMKDYTMEFTYIGEGDTYLQLNLGDIQDSVSAIPGGFFTLAEAGVMFYVPSSYLFNERTEDDIVRNRTSAHVEQIDADGDNINDNAIYTYFYKSDTISSYEQLLEACEAWDNIQALYPIMINGRSFIYVEILNNNFHYYRFETIDDNACVLEIVYIIEHGISADNSRSFVHNLAAAIYPAA
ncbi:MAG: hypothetical protein IKR00_02705 [Lachnospiraceae bacterium]|nr:hypothetical protein [Lachnospiraceae bacterium]